MIMERPFSEPKWEPWSAKTHSTTIDGFTIARRPFTPPAPVQTQEFWRLLEHGEVRQDGDECYVVNSRVWQAVDHATIGFVFANGQQPVRRRVTVPVAAPVAVAPKPEPSGDYGEYRQRLFEYIDNTFGRAPLVSEMDEVEHIVLGYFKHKAHEPIPDSPDPGCYFVSVDGHEAPTQGHTALKDARIEAERLARQECPARARVLRQVAVAIASVQVKWEGEK